jgi:type VI secretion system protein ImpI
MPTGPMGGVPQTTYSSAGAAEKRAMALNLQLVNETTLPDGGPVSFRISGKRGIDIGRDAHLDWTLPDPTRYISSKHCEIRYEDGGYWLHDVSTNGTFLNGADHRMHAPHRLRTGDRFTVGHYIVAVTVEGEEGSADAGRSAAPPQSANYEELWASPANVAPPIDPKQLKAARHNAPVHSDFLDWAADVPDPFRAPAPSYPAPPSAVPGPAPRSPPSPDMDWAEGPPSYVPAPPPPPPPTPAPRRPGWDTQGGGSWEEATPVAAAAALPSRDAPTAASATVSPEAFVRQLARAAGLPEDVLAQKDPGELAQQVGGVLRLVVENLLQLLSARRQAKVMARSASHTTIQALDNNPLKFSPTAADALRMMFGPATPGYLDAQRAIGQGFEDLKIHQLKTYSAMQQALTRLTADLDPQAITQDADEGRGIADLLVSRKAKLWDAYEARWEAKIGRGGGSAIAAFMSYFAEAYDRDGV